jgi:hypothetical protein
LSGWLQRNSRVANLVNRSCISRFANDMATPWQIHGCNGSPVHGRRFKGFHDASPKLLPPLVGASGPLADLAHARRRGPMLLCHGQSSPMIPAASFSLRSLGPCGRTIQGQLAASRFEATRLLDDLGKTKLCQPRRTGSSPELKLVGTPGWKGFNAPCTACFG